MEIFTGHYAHIRNSGIVFWRSYPKIRNESILGFMGVLDDWMPGANKHRKKRKAFRNIRQIRNTSWWKYHITGNCSADNHYLYNYGYDNMEDSQETTSDSVSNL